MPGLFSEPTGLMFHHFHGTHHPALQGSIDAATFRKILDFAGLENIISAQQWLERAEKGQLKNSHLCITFDDTLLSQYDIAKPVLDDLGIKAFWFVYSSVLRGELEKLEIYRYFRTTVYSHIDHFYEEFFELAAQLRPEAGKAALAAFDPSSYLPNSPFYTDNDRKFRYLRDQVLQSDEYDSLMERMISRSEFTLGEIVEKIWLTQAHVKSLAEEGHIIGLHSDTHPTTMAKLPVDIQKKEYGTNSEYLSSLLGEPPVSMSHPCNSYSSTTLSTLRNLGIRVGFRADIAVVSDRTELEYPREDHANLAARIAKLESSL